MKHSLLNIAGVAALAAGMAIAQTPPAQPAQPAQPSGGGRHGAMMNRFGADLNLTDAQKQQAREIFSQSRQASQAIREQIRQSRQALGEAVKSGAPDAQIDKLASNLGPLMAQQRAIHAKAFAKFYGTLTQDQKDKV